MREHFIETLSHYNGESSLSKGLKMDVAKDIAQDVAISLLSLLRLMVDEPNDVSVSSSKQLETITFQVSVSRHDMGKVIGKQGRIVRALRIILSAISMATDVRLNLEIVGEANDSDR